MKFNFEFQARIFIFAAPNKHFAGVAQLVRASDS